MFLEDVEVTEVFGPGGSALMSSVQCNGSETELQLCHSEKSGTLSYKNHREASAGVLCDKHFGESCKNV